MVEIESRPCIECQDELLWQKPFEDKVCPLCEEGRSLSSVYGEGAPGDARTLAAEGAKALGIKRRWEDLPEKQRDDVRWA